jgi:hypothetical protein
MIIAPVFRTWFRDAINFGIALLLAAFALAWLLL